MKNSYLKELSKIFEANANAESAVWMKKYMRNKFEYYGIQTPIRKKLAIEFFNKNGKPDITMLEEIVEELWDLPQREYQYFATTLLFNMVTDLNKKHVKLLEKIITTKSWWDTVDFIAIKLVGNLFQDFPELIPKHTNKWIISPNIWLNRTAILFQLHYKQRTNFNLLSELILKSAHSKEFFIQKAIGWALREFSKTDKKAVRNFVKINQLSPLSNREALKWLNRKKK